MKNFKNFLSAILTGLIVLAFVSCEKNDNGAGNGAKCLIQSKTDYYLFGTDTLKNSYSFSYNANGMLSRVDMVHSLYEDDLDYFLFFYDNTGKIEKIEEHYESFITKTLFTYENNKVTGERWIIYDNENPKPKGRKFVYELNNAGEIVKINDYLKYNEEWQLMHYQDNEWQNGNLVKAETYHTNKYKKDPGKFFTKPINPFTGKLISDEKENIFDPRNMNNNFVKQFTYEVTYDNKNNPFFEPHYALRYTFLTGLGHFPSSPDNTNNELSAITTIHSSDDIYTYTYTFSYEYNLFRYPTGSNVYLENDNDTTLIRISNIVYDCNK